MSFGVAKVITSESGIVDCELMVCGAPALALLGFV